MPPRPSPPDLPFDDLFRPWTDSSGVVLAVSGGSDSIALMHLAARWHQRHGGPPLHVATVDHGLRAGSAADAAFVMVEAEKLALPAVCLPWLGPKPERAIQERAREVRYRLIAEHARERGADAIATAHTLDDQAETLLFRMARGSGPRGLVGMRVRSARLGVTHWRPLLGVAKEDLVAQCRFGRWPFVEDPSNGSQRFARVRWRSLMPDLAREGLDAARLGLLARRMARVEEALDRRAATVGVTTARREGERLLLGFGSLAREPAEIALRVLELSLAEVGQTRPRLERLERLMVSLEAAWTARRALRRTLNGCRIELDEVGTLTLRPEGGLRRRGMKDRQACGSETEAVPLATPEGHHTLPCDAERPAGCMPHDALPMT